MTKAKTKSTNNDSGVKISDLKDGDVVLVKMTYVCNVDESYGEYPHFSTTDGKIIDTDSIEDSDIHSILESPIRVGDKVRFKTLMFV